MRPIQLACPSAFASRNLATRRESGPEALRDCRSPLLVLRSRLRVGDCQAELRVELLDALGGKPEKRASLSSAIASCLLIVPTRMTPVARE